MRWWKWEQRKRCSENGWKPLRMTVYGLGVEDGPHTGRETSAAKKTRPTITKELSEELLFSANRREKGSPLQQWEPCCGCGDHRNGPGGGEKPRKTASITLEEQGPSKLLLALHFHISSFLPPCTGHSTLQLHQPCELQQMPHRGSRSPTLLQTQQGGNRGFLWADLHQLNPNPVASCCSSPYGFWENLVILDLKENKENFGKCASLNNSPQKEQERKTGSHCHYF